MPRKLRDVRAIMNTSVTTVSPDTRVAEVASLMQARRVTLVVVIEQGEPIGVVSERDLVNKVVAPGLAAREVICREIMTSPAHTVSVDMDLGAAYEEMEEVWSRRMVAVDRAGRLVGVLTQSDLIAGMYRELKDTLFENEILHERSLAREKLAEQARIAREIQRHLLPERAPALGSIELAGSNTQAYEVGGDFFDYILIDDETVGVVIGDVVGNGIPAAILMAMTRSVLRSQALSHASPADVLRGANLILVAERLPAQFVTAAYCVAHRGSRDLVMSSAGHLPMIVYRKADEKTELVDGKGLPLGVQSDGYYEEQHVSFAPGDAALLYTDGIIEARNRNGKLFGITRLAKAFRECAESAPPVVLERIAAMVTGFAGDSGEHHLDDRTAIALRCV